jgi:hypothetical protein
VTPIFREVLRVAAYEEVGVFKGKKDWRTLDPEMLDVTRCSAFLGSGLSVLPSRVSHCRSAGELRTAYPLFHLTGGFSVCSVEVPVQSRVLVRKSGGSVLLNPKRYGAMTFCDYARYRLSVFTKEEAKAIVAYLKYRRDTEIHGIDRDQIDAALNSFWLDRAEHAPSGESLEKHMREENEFVAEIGGNAKEKT